MVDNKIYSINLPTIEFRSSNRLKLNQPIVKKLQLFTDSMNLMLDTPMTPTNFNIEFNSFKCTAFCVTHALLDVWCIVQYAAIALFLVGIVIKSKWFFMPYLILDSIFLLTVFVYVLVFLCIELNFK